MDGGQQAKQQIVDKLKNTTNILVTVSTNPSVDELTAALALTLMLNKMKKTATAVFSGTMPPAIQFLEPQKTFEGTVDSLRDFIVALDKQKAGRIKYKVDGNMVRIFITPYRTVITQKDLEFSQGDFNVETIVALGVERREEIDKAISAHGRILHDATVITISAKHEGNNLGSIDWQEGNVSSLSEMLMSLSEALQPGILDQQIATALLTGIVAATGRFSNQKTSPRVMTMAAQLMAAGANQQLIASKLQERPAQSAKPAGPGRPDQKSDKEDATVVQLRDEKGQDQSGRNKNTAAPGKNQAGQGKPAAADKPADAAAPAPAPAAPPEPPKKKPNPNGELEISHEDAAAIAALPPAFQAAAVPRGTADEYGLDPDTLAEKRRQEAINKAEAELATLPPVDDQQIPSAEQIENDIEAEEGADAGQLTDEQVEAEPQAEEQSAPQPGPAVEIPADDAPVDNRADAPVDASAEFTAAEADTAEPYAEPTTEQAQPYADTPQPAPAAEEPAAADDTTAVSDDSQETAPNFTQAGPEPEAGPESGQAFTQESGDTAIAEPADQGGDQAELPPVAPIMTPGPEQKEGKSGRKRRRRNNKDGEQYDDAVIPTPPTFIPTPEIPIEAPQPAALAEPVQVDVPAPQPESIIEPVPEPAAEAIQEPVVEAQPEPEPEPEPEPAPIADPAPQQPVPAPAPAPAPALDFDNVPRSEPKIEKPHSSIPAEQPSWMSRDLMNEPSLGGSLSATVQQAAEDKAREAEEASRRNHTILSHNDGGESRPVAPVSLPEPNPVAPAEGRVEPEQPSVADSLVSPSVDVTAPLPLPPLPPPPPASDVASPLSDSISEASPSLDAARQALEEALEQPAPVIAPLPPPAPSADPLAALPPVDPAAAALPPVPVAELPADVAPPYEPLAPLAPLPAPSFDTPATSDLPADYEATPLPPPPPPAMPPAPAMMDMPAPSVVPPLPDPAVQPPLAPLPDPMAPPLPAGLPPLPGAPAFGSPLPAAPDLGVPPALPQDMPPLTPPMPAPAPAAPPSPGQYRIPGQ
ncbi:hypothetical protein JNJ66_06700 [Candidatus Saccharibacteria bacterium]|nr:hypothetical protein [Candidatus Saccharibacteria bacterium]